MRAADSRPYGGNVHERAITDRPYGGKWTPPEPSEAGPVGKTTRTPEGEPGLESPGERCGRYEEDREGTGISVCMKVPTVERSLHRDGDRSLRGRGTRRRRQGTRKRATDAPGDGGCGLPRPTLRRWSRNDRRRREEHDQGEDKDIQRGRLRADGL